MWVCLFCPFTATSVDCQVNTAVFRLWLLDLGGVKRMELRFPPCPHVQVFFFNKHQNTEGVICHRHRKRKIRAQVFTKGNQSSAPYSWTGFEQDIGPNKVQWSFPFLLNYAVVLWLVHFPYFNILKNIFKTSIHLYQISIILQRCSYLRQIASVTASVSDVL